MFSSRSCMSFLLRLSCSLPLDSHHHRDVFLFYSGFSVAGWMCMRVICQKNLARLLDCVGALKHEAKWRDAAQSEPNATKHNTLRQCRQPFFIHQNLMKKSMICRCCVSCTCLRLSAVSMIFWLWVKQMKLRSSVDVKRSEDACSLLVWCHVLEAILNKSLTENVNVHHIFTLISI